MEILGFFTTLHFYRDTITWQGCQRKYELFSSPLSDYNTYSPVSLIIFDNSQEPEVVRYRT